MFLPRPELIQVSSWLFYLFYSFVATYSTRTAPTKKKREMKRKNNKMWKVMKACVSRCWGITWHCLFFSLPYIFSFSLPLHKKKNFFTCSFSFLIQFDLRYLHFQNRFSRATAAGSTTAFSSVIFIFFLLLMLMPLNFKVAALLFSIFPFLSNGISLPLPLPCGIKKKKILNKNGIEKFQY